MELAIPQKRLGPLSFFACILAINLAVILSIDTYVPALPGMQREFGVTEAYLNLTMFAYFFFSAVAVVVAGPLSDRLGRRRVLILSCALYLASSLGCMASPSVEVLVLFRVGQALAYGAVVTLCTALIKDAYDGESMQKAMTALQSLIIVGPAAAPFLGTFLLSVWDWRGIFAFLAACGALSLGASLLISEPASDGPEASAKAPAKTPALQTLRSLVGERDFLSLALLMGVTGIPYFAFIATVSYILMDFFGSGYLEYSLIYFAACVVTIVAPYCYLWLSKRLDVPAILRLSIAAVLISFAALALAGTMGPWAFLLAFVPYALAEGVVRPMAFVVLLDRPDDQVGTASSFANFSYSILTSIATVFATLPWANFVQGLVVITGASGLVMLGLYLWRQAGAKAGR